MTDREMVVALLAWLQARGVGTYRTDGSVYLATETGLFYGQIGPEPNRGVALARYDRTDYGQRRDAVRTRRVQAWIRGKPHDTGDADDLADAVDDALLALSRTSGINHVGHLSGPALHGSDGNSRSELSLNYSVTLED
ncbi:minor capsid protein [Promicromonospora vindobonensis]|uniref:Minor capsid protein n=1 Tax=Promicromonospora vindobonensis TaxID=195748 RepID=A0ABW5VNR2_9MICO